LLCFLDHTIHLCEEVLQKSLRRLEGVRDAFVAYGSVPMVAGQSLPGELELLRGPHGACVVVAEDPYSKPILIQIPLSCSRTLPSNSRSVTRSTPGLFIDLDCIIC